MRARDGPAFGLSLDAKESGVKGAAARSSMRERACLATYWAIFIILPVALIWSHIPASVRWAVTLPAGFALVLIGERGIRRWKRIWRVK